MNRSGSEKRLEHGSFGPIGASLRDLRFFHLATVLGLMLYRSAGIPMLAWR
jgi:hypothetical protein